MTLLRSLGRKWARLRDGARREYRRDPDVILFDRQAAPAREDVHVR